MPTRLVRILCGFLAVVATFPAIAKDPYRLAVTVDGASRNFGFNSVDAAIDQINFAALARDFGYFGNEMVAVNLDLRGLPVILKFAATEQRLYFRMPGLKLARDVAQETGTTTDFVYFNGETRADSIRLLKKFLKENKFALKAILTALARQSAIDPLAGNPLSLMTQKMKTDFRDGFTHKVSQIWGCGTSAFNFSNEAPIMVAALGATGDIFADAQRRAAEMRSGNQFGIGLGYTSLEANGYRSTGIDVPLSYTANLDRLPGHKLRFDLPLSYVDTEGATTYAVGLGIAYTYPMSEVWTLTPGVGVGATGSEDLGSAGGVGSFSVTSAYTWRLGDYALSMGNSVGKYDSLPIKLGDIQAEADVKNVAYTNGLLLSGPNSLIARNLMMEFSIQDTRLSGDEVYSQVYDEVGVALGYINNDMGIISSYFKGGVSYLVGDNDIRALKLNFSARF